MTDVLHMHGDYGQKASSLESIVCVHVTSKFEYSKSTKGQGS